MKKTILLLFLTVFVVGCDLISSDDIITDFKNLEQYLKSPKKMITIKGSVDYFPREINGRLIETSIVDNNGYHIFFLPYRSDQSFEVGDILEIRGFLSRSNDGKYYIMETATPIVKK